MQKICANTRCKQAFEIHEADLQFLDKVAPVFNGKKGVSSPSLSLSRLPDATKDALEE
jgi:hypothetical protein